MNKPISSFQGRPIVAQQAGITITRVGAYLGAEITGIDLRQPMSDEQRDAIENALAENELLIFRNQDINSQNLIDLGSQIRRTHCPSVRAEGQRRLGSDQISQRRDQSAVPH